MAHPLVLEKNLTPTMMMIINSKNSNPNKLKNRVGVLYNEKKKREIGEEENTMSIRKRVGKAENIMGKGKV